MNPYQHISVRYVGKAAPSSGSADGAVETRPMSKVDRFLATFTSTSVPSEAEIRITCPTVDRRT